MTKAPLFSGEPLSGPQLAEPDARALEHFIHLIQTEGKFAIALSSYGKAPTEHKQKMLKRRLKAIRDEIVSVESEQESEATKSLRDWLVEIVIPYVNFWEYALAAGEVKPGNQPPWRFRVERDGSTVRFFAGEKE